MTTQFNWLSYLEVAQHLSAQQEQGFRRSAISGPITEYLATPETLCKDEELPSQLVEMSTGR